MRKGDKTPYQDAEIQERQNVLRRRIISWLEIRKVYIPNDAIAENESSVDHPNTTPPESMPLGLPSAMPLVLRGSSCLFDLPELERRLRLAQADDALSDLRKQLRVRMGLLRYKTTQIGPSQRMATRSRALIKRFAEKTDRCAERYRASRSALLALNPDGDWQTRLRDLKDDDIKSPGKGDDEAEGTREISWIWRVEYRTASSVSAPNDFASISDADLVDCV